VMNCNTSAQRARTTEPLRTIRTQTSYKRSGAWSRGWNLHGTHLKGRYRIIDYVELFNGDIDKCEEELGERDEQQARVVVRKVTQRLLCCTRPARKPVKAGPSTLGGEPG
jgi:hypothetical protein